MVTICLDTVKVELRIGLDEMEMRSNLWQSAIVRNQGPWVPAPE